MSEPSATLINAILAMDVYNRGVNPGLVVSFNTIGSYQVGVTDSGWVQIGGSYTVSATETGLLLYSYLLLAGRRRASALKAAPFPSIPGIARPVQG